MNKDLKLYSKRIYPEAKYLVPKTRNAKYEASIQRLENGEAVYYPEHITEDKNGKKFATFRHWDSSVVWPVKDLEDLEEEIPPELMVGDENFPGFGFVLDDNREGEQGVANQNDAERGDEMANAVEEVDDILVSAEPLEVKEYDDLKELLIEEITSKQRKIGRPRKRRTFTGNSQRNIRHKCPRCTEIFSQLSVLKTHALRCFGLKLFVCKICKRQCTTQSNLNSHKKAFHRTKPQ